MASSLTTLVAYVGPDAFLPLTSVLAAAVGVFMMFGRAGVRLIFGGALVRMLFGRGRPAGPHPRPLRRKSGAMSGVSSTQHPDD